MNKHVHNLISLVKHLSYFFFKKYPIVCKFNFDFEQFLYVIALWNLFYSGKVYAPRTHGV